MPKLIKLYYFNSAGEKKINCYKINISKKILEKSGIKDTDNLNIYAKDDKIVIEKEK